MPNSSPRIARSRHYLMCRPSFYTVSYSINPWMDPEKPTDTGLAISQWEGLYRLYRELGHRVELIDPVPGLPDMVYAANGATVFRDRVLIANFRHEERAAEAAAYKDWFHGRGYTEVHTAAHVNEGEGDYLVVGDRILAGTGFRTVPSAHTEAQDVLGAPVISLELVDPRFYHLDTALAVLDDDLVMYNPDAFSAASLGVLRELFPDAILADTADADAFGLNAVSDGRHVVLPKAASGLAAKVAARGFEPIGLDLSELLKGGGSVKCCTLEIRHAAIPEDSESPS
jgi:N-dimethylarginine dimethylaminohydrolase